MVDWVSLFEDDAATYRDEKRYNDLLIDVPNKDPALVVALVRQETHKELTPEFIRFINDDTLEEFSEWRAGMDLSVCSLLHLMKYMSLYEDYFEDLQDVRNIAAINNCEHYGYLDTMMWMKYGDTRTFQRNRTDFMRDLQECMAEEDPDDEEELRFALFHAGNNNRLKFRRRLLTQGVTLAVALKETKRWRLAFDNACELMAQAMLKTEKRIRTEDVTEHARDYAGTFFDVAEFLNETVKECTADGVRNALRAAYALYRLYNADEVIDRTDVAVLGDFFGIDNHIELEQHMKHGHYCSLVHAAKMLKMFFVFRAATEGNDQAIDQIIAWQGESTEDRDRVIHHKLKKQRHSIRAMHSLLFHT